MPHTCAADGCNNRIFSSNYCRYHQYLRRMTGGDLYKPAEALSPKSNTIHRRTPKRASDERYYAVQAKEFFDDAVNDGTNQCFFCGERVLTFQGLHHLQGRRNGDLLNFEYIVIVHNSCHLYYHSATVEQLMKKDWYCGFLERLREKSETAFDKEMKKRDKLVSLF